MSRQQPGSWGCPRCRCVGPSCFWARNWPPGGGAGAALSEVVQRLQLWVAAQPRDAQAWQLLASAYAAQGQPLRAIRAEAEVQMARLDYPAAQDRLKAAQSLVHQSRVPDHIEASIIDTRQRQVTQLLKEQALDH